MARLQDPVTILKGVGFTRAKQLEGLGIRTLQDLICHFPRGYEDRTRLVTIGELEEGVPACFRAMVAGSPRAAHIRKGLDLTRVQVADHTARLTLTLACGSKEADYMMEAQRQGSAFLFRLESHFPNVTSQSDQRLVSQAKAEDDAFFDLFHWTTTDRPMPPYTLEFFDGSGALLGTYTNPAGEEGTE